jgi:hypothetical protein
VTITGDQWIERVQWMEIIVNMQGEDNFEAKCSIDHVVKLVQKVVDSNIANDYMDVDSIVILLPSQIT